MSSEDMSAERREEVRILRKWIVGLLVAVVVVLLYLTEVGVSRAIMVLWVALIVVGTVNVYLTYALNMMINERLGNVGSELFLRALEGGAAAGGQAQEGIQKGAAADFVVLSDDDPMMAGHGDASRLDALVFSGFPLPVERVMVDGEWHVVDAMHVKRDLARDAYSKAIVDLGLGQ